jgi:putative endonuclease
MTFVRQQLGLFGEDCACEELERRGHVVVARRYKTEHGEIDIVTRHHEFTVFVEVKLKSSVTFGDPSEAVTPTKQQRIVWMATDYVTRFKLEDTPCRFDVVAVECECHPPRVTVIEDAFRPGW